jgi:hypothetical protein
MLGGVCKNRESSWGLVMFPFLYFQLFINVFVFDKRKQIKREKERDLSNIVYLPSS